MYIKFTGVDVMFLYEFADFENRKDEDWTASYVIKNLIMISLHTLNLNFASIYFLCDFS